MNTPLPTPLRAAVNVERTHQIIDQEIAAARQALTNATIKLAPYDDAAFRAGCLKNALDSLNRAMRIASTQAVLDQLQRSVARNF